MLNHITQVMKHYKDGGTVVAWDVVNEAWENDGTKFWDTPFSSKLGMGFVDDAFTAARAADSKAKLYYNDYRADGMNAKANAIYTMVKGMVERGVPIDGVGIQVHTGTPNAPSTPADILLNMQRITALGLDVVISEMDVHVCDGLTTEQQKQYYHDVIAACVKVPRCTAITFWGASDKYSWVKDFNETNCAGKNPSACLWDDNWMKKPAYYGVMDALTGK
jgi:endo-1,4-beta-xylanase